MKHLLCLLFVLALAAPVAAQTATPAVPTGIEVRVFASGVDPNTGTPLGVKATPIDPAVAYCNLAPPSSPASPLINPSFFWVDDPFFDVVNGITTARTGKVCRVPLPSGLPSGINHQSVGLFTAPTCDDGNGNTLSPCRGPISVVGQPPFVISPVIVRPVQPSNPRNR